jgi:hypothetical protein
LCLTASILRSLRSPSVSLIFTSGVAPSERHPEET